MITPKAGRPLRAECVRRRLERWLRHGHGLIGVAVDQNHREVADGLELVRLMQVWMNGGRVAAMAAQMSRCLMPRNIAPAPLRLAPSAYPSDPVPMTPGPIHG